jgi:Na+-transporting NADH:ubiquinone oxidoreductase subunit F
MPIFVPQGKSISMLIFTSIVAFTAVILLLVGLLIFAQKKLVQSGPVKIVINGEKNHYRFSW